MPSESVPSSAADETFAAELSAALRKHGLRGAYAEKLQAEWLGHYANLRDSLPAEEAIARLGSPEELAASAARSRFEGRWWCAAPVVSGILGGILFSVGFIVFSVLPVFFALRGDPAWGWTAVTIYAQLFNVLGGLAAILILFWASGRYSSPPRFRQALMLSFAVLVLFLTMDFNAPGGQPGTGSFSFGALVDAAGTLPTQLMIYLLLAFRLTVFVIAFRWCRRAA